MIEKHHEKKECIQWFELKKSVWSWISFDVCTLILFMSLSATLYCCRTSAGIEREGNYLNFILSSASVYLCSIETLQHQCSDDACQLVNSWESQNDQDL